MAEYITTSRGRKIAYHLVAGKQPGVVFLGGYASDMEGTKAVYLENWAKTHGHGYLRFDYSGHGASSGAFSEGTISDWAADAHAAIEELTQGAQILVGSSMGGWIALLLAREIPRCIAGIITIAGAPDFTQECMWENFDPPTRAKLLEEGQITLPSDYASDYIVTRQLIEDGRKNSVLRTPLICPFPVRILQGSADKDVPPALAERLFYHLEGSDIRLHLVKGAEHRFSNPAELALIRREIEDMISLVKST